MRPTRFVAALIALFLAATLPLVSSSGAQAAIGHQTTERTKSVTIKFSANGARAFRLSGAIKPAARGKTVVLLRATKLRGHYGKIGTTRTDRQGRYTFSGLKRVGYYAVSSGGARSKVIHVCKGSC
jgi:hypothetical protein